MLVQKLFWLFFSVSAESALSLSALDEYFLTSGWLYIEDNITVPIKSIFRWN